MNTQMRKPLRSFASFVHTVARITFGRIESVITRRQGHPPWPPIFVVGPSRAGTTLLFQALVNGLELAYTFNLMDRFPFFPVTVALLARPLGSCAPRRTYHSRFGITPGWNGPSSAYGLWNRWFTDTQGMMSTTIRDEKARQEMIGTLALLEHIYGMPLVTKWTGNSARIPELATSFPKAVFIRVKRDYLQIAQSMLHARRQLSGDEYQPIITWPREFKQQTQTHYTCSICQHIQRIEAAIAEGEEIADSQRFTTVAFEQLCATPRTVIADIREHYARCCGYRIPWRNELPASFEHPFTLKVDPAEYVALSACLDKLGMEHDKTHVIEMAGLGSND